MDKGDNLKSLTTHNILLYFLSFPFRGFPAQDKIGTRSRIRTDTVVILSHVSPSFGLHGQNVSLLNIEKYQNRSKEYLLETIQSQHI